jgi:hypothetical protein
LLALLTARIAGASDISDEVSAGTSFPAAHDPKTSFISDRLAGSWDASEKLALSLDAIWTRYDSHTGVAPDDVFNFLLAADWEATEHWSLGAELHGSPRSTAKQGIPIRFGQPIQTGRAVVAAESASYGGSISAEYDTAGDSDFESNVALDFGVTEYAATQHLTAIKTAAGQRLNVAQIREFCALHACGRPLRTAVEGNVSSPLQARATLDVTETLVQNTDLGFTGNYYLYSSAPGDTGYYQLTSLGRVLMGDGFPFEPPRYSIRGTLVERIGGARLSGFSQYARYASENGYALLFGAKFQITPADTLKTWLFADLQRDVPESAKPFITLWGGVGARLSL